ncbi:MAG: lytic murein transglycosylase [Rhodospirillales bacterium]|nr:lytic murein transglycosylase [Rhodospirillales bacterium]
MAQTTNRRAVLAGLAGLGALAAGSTRANDVSFDEWLRGFREEAAQKGIKRGSLDQTLAGVAPIARVLELDRAQPEVRLTFEQYFARVVNRARIDTGRARVGENRDLLSRVVQRYPVQPRFIVALWAVETDFGRITGGFNIFAALATLAYDGRRSQFFRDELLNAIRIVDRGLAKASDMRGSWAGAMGQSQFMPSSFLSYAVDFDGDGRADIWNSKADVFASIANYLVRAGWRGDETWGHEARLPAGFDRALVDHNKVAKPVAEWAQLGVRPASASAVVAPAAAASIVQPDGEGGRAFLVYGNFKVIMRWNRSVNFATSVGLLADSIGEV